MTDKKSNESRRKLLKSIAASGGAVVAGKSLPESWSKPIVDSVLLPVHAETTDDTGNLPTEPVCCDGYVCSLEFSQQVPLGGRAELSNCVITFIGGSISGDWAGSGPIAADGSFSFNIVFTMNGQDVSNQTISGTVSADCLSISGSITGWADFTGVIVDAEAECEK